MNSYETIKEMSSKIKQFYHKYLNGDIKEATATFKLMEEKQKTKCKNLKKKKKKLQLKILS